MHILVREFLLALLWSYQSGSNHYRVTSAGRTVRLYTNGVFHSQFNPERPLGGGLWDLLSLPVLYLPPKKSFRVLVLGVGGGAVINQLHQLLDAPTIVGVDIDPVHLKISKRWFGVSASRATLIENDAKKWVEKYSGKKFNFIIDDLFGEHDGEPVRAVDIDSQWARQLKRLLCSDGLIIANYLHKRQMRESALTHDPQFKLHYRFEHPLYQNCVGVHGRQHISMRDWKANLLQHTSLKAAQIQTALGVRISKIR